MLIMQLYSSSQGPRRATQNIVLDLRNAEALHRAFYHQTHLPALPSKVQMGTSIVGSMPDLNGRCWLRATTHPRGSEERLNYNRQLEHHVLPASVQMSRLARVPGCLFLRLFTSVTDTSRKIHSLASLHLHTMTSKLADIQLIHADREVKYERYCPTTIHCISC